jgi:hypothetical protein
MNIPYVAMEGFKFGCDPELFIFDSDDNPVCAEGIIPGDKENPFPVKSGAVQVDGMAAEFNIDPVSTFEEFDYNIVTVMKELKKFLPAGHTLKMLPSVTFTPDVWKSSPVLSKRLGCTPDFNAWTGGVNLPPNGNKIPRMRTASGHLHIGWREPDPSNLGDAEHVQHCRDLVKQLDWYLGSWSLQSDHDPVRRSLYGKAGACRYKPYGVEYRVLSNFWLKNKSTRQAVWDRMQQAIWDMSSFFVPDQAEALMKEKGTNFNDLLVESINSSSLPNKLVRPFEFPIITTRHSHMRKYA